jgi:hypothetical protein
MIAIIVQFIRNFCCVLKSLLPSNSILQIRHELNILSFASKDGYGYSILELIIALTQFLAVLFNIYYGIKDLLNGLKENKKLQKWIIAMDSFALNEDARSSITKLSNNNFVSLQSYVITRQFIDKEKKSKEYQLIAGIWQIIFGVSFMFLCLNTLRMVQPKPVIDALIAMEIGLAYFLVYMWDSFLEKVKLAGRQYYLSNKVGSTDAITKSSILQTYLQEGGYDINNIHKSVLVLDDKYHPEWRNELANESEPSTETLVATFRSVSSLLDDLVEIKKKEDEDTKKLLLRNAEITYSFALLDLVYFLLNFIAGHGYMMGILAFYLPTNNSYLLKLYFLGFSHSDADWYGNFTGDLAWTIEPVLILLVSAIGHLTKPKEEEKVKKD